MYKKSAPGSIDALNAVILDSDVDPACHTMLSSLQSIIPQCWEFDPQQRPSASRISQSIAIPSKEEARLGGSEGQEEGISSPQIVTSPAMSSVRPQLPSDLSKPSSSSSQQSYGSGGPPPRPSRANTSNLNDIFSSNYPSGDSPPSASKRSSTQGKNKKGMLSLMSDVSSRFLTTAKHPEISTPYDPVHLTHVGVRSSTGEYIGIPKPWQSVLDAQERDPENAAKILESYQRTATG
ncbi:signal transducing kinase of the PAK [Tulasnella sp. 408]|nr:signal transducing kinase of the PAK [Tulasnella sp. 408]